MAKQNFQEYICRPYCMFFKEGQKEDMTCQAAAHVVELLAHGKSIDMMKMPPLKKESRLWRKYKESLGSHICPLCPFYASDCDFQATEPVDYMVEPCGGFILLSHLYENNLIHAMDMEERK